MNRKKNRCKNRRVLVVDDNRSIHEDFRKILEPCAVDRRLEETGAALLGDAHIPPVVEQHFSVDSAYQGREALARVGEAVREGSPYAMAFLDVRMPSGWDGLETALRIWRVDPKIIIVFCTAYSDHSWDVMARALGDTGRFLLLKKPLENLELRQLATFLSDRLWVEEQLNDYKQHLEELVQQRTAELAAANEELDITNRRLEQEVAERAGAEQQLANAKHAAEAANRAKDEFLANISHEIRTPMTAILGFTDLLTENLQEPENLQAGKTIKQNGQYLLGIINDLLDLSKIEAGRIEVRRARCSPCRLVAEVASLMKIRADGKGLPLELEYRWPLPRSIRTDPLRLRQILINLVANAIKFTETGRIRLVTRLLARPGQKAQLCFDVVDTGIGMTRRQAEALFRPFTQSDSSTTRRFCGTGLGLTISRRLAEMLGGTIEVSSRYGRGSTFSAFVDAGPLEGVEMLQSDDEMLGPDEPPAPRPPAEQDPLDCRILLVEDGPDNQRLLSFLLRRAGAEVTVAENGKIAVEKALTADPPRGRTFDDPAEPFDLILMDMQMPVMDGYQATRRLRAAGYHGAIVALTAHAMSHDEQKCRAAGCDDYLSKPVKAEKLLRMVRKHLRTAALQS